MVWPFPVKVPGVAERLTISKPLATRQDFFPERRFGVITNWLGNWASVVLVLTPDEGVSELRDKGHLLPTLSPRGSQSKIH